MSGQLDVSGIRCPRSRGMTEWRRATSSQRNGGTHSDYIVYVDESGDHSLTSIDPEYPVFVLSFCIFRQGEYAQTVTPSSGN